MLEEAKKFNNGDAHRFEPELVKRRISRLKDDKLMDIERLERQTNWECWLNSYIDRFIDMNGRVKEHRQINHFDGAGNTASFPSKSCKPVPLRKVVTFDQMCF